MFYSKSEKLFLFFIALTFFLGVIPWGLIVEPWFVGLGIQLVGGLCLVPAVYYLNKFSNHE